jgi:hypothetical protein
MTAHAIRTSLLARATAALFGVGCSRSSNIHLLSLLDLIRPSCCGFSLRFFVKQQFE